MQKALERLLLFSKLETDLKSKIVAQMYERYISPGEILIKEGDTGLAASELYVVTSGEFEVSTSEAFGVGVGSCQAFEFGLRSCTQASRGGARPGWGCCERVAVRGLFAWRPASCIWSVWRF